MFVKIIRKKDGNWFRESIYECGRAKLEDSGSQVLIELEDCPTGLGKENISVSFDKQELTVYFMNNQGKTIDSRNFQEKKNGSDCRRSA